MVEPSLVKESVSSSQFRIKAPSKTTGSLYIQDIIHEFTDGNGGDTNSEVLCVRFDDADKYIGASYTNGTIKIFNSFTGKVGTVFVNNFNALEETRAPINMFRFKPPGVHGGS